MLYFSHASLPFLFHLHLLFSVVPLGYRVVNVVGTNNLSRVQETASNPSRVVHLFLFRILFLIHHMHTLHNH